MHEHEWLAEEFEANRTRLRAVAYRMLGSLSEADDAVQESWLHLSRSGTSGVENLGGWLTTVVARQLASRARRRVQGAATVPESDRVRQREVVDAFLAASRGGDFAALLALLDPDVVLRADPEAIRVGAAEEVRGATAVAKTFAGRARFAQPALVNGAAGLVWAPGGRPRVVFAVRIARGKIVEIDLVADPERLRELDLAILEE